ncbi:hypothetical protein CWATWH0402_1633 [Crocosphaera watsonii WH 0402]|uniref:Uncharacterized protein n=2 Tax=Crocosphaera watsonii TaxID=263511 RepID=T2JHV1_CROWT|nr:hypothetical protein CWATWH0005_5817 [Crocosphaera watsonii WH 0005]CCQ64706.1 hypothetical protein CWATWH0402_1633 [Crocosphaera watsonii WH 0402]
MVGFFIVHFWLMGESEQPLNYLGFLERLSNIAIFSGF